MPVMEVTRIAVAPERSDELRTARPAMLAAFTQRPGFIRADLVQVSDTEWLDLIVWARSEDFTESRRRGADSEAVAAFFAAIESVVSSEEGRLWER